MAHRDKFVIKSMLLPSIELLGCRLGVNVGVFSLRSLSVVALQVSKGLVNYSLAECLLRYYPE